MGTFSASLRAIGDIKPLPATVELSDGRLSIIAGEIEIGSWPLSEVHLEEIPTGYRLAAEGEQILIELKELDSFTAELGKGKKRRLSARGRKQSKAANPTPAPETAKVEERPARSSVTLPPREEAPQKKPRREKTRKEKPSREKSSREKTSGWTAKGLAFLDGTLERANKRFGAYLPEWIFTRAMFLIAFGALTLMVLAPGAVSVFLLIAGALMIVFGAIVYTDPMLASRWLPGRTTPQHALLFGVAILMMGVLLGVLAK